MMALHSRVLLYHVHQLAKKLSLSLAVLCTTLKQSSLFTLNQVDAGDDLCEGEIIYDLAGLFSAGNSFSARKHVQQRVEHHQASDGDEIQFLKEVHHATSRRTPQTMCSENELFFRLADTRALHQKATSTKLLSALSFRVCMLRIKFTFSARVSHIKRKNVVCNLATESDGRGTNARPNVQLGV